MELKVIGGSKSKVSVSEATFAREYNEPLVHQVVTACLAGARQGTRKQKNRSAVSGGGAKPWRQKGTGRARAGTTRGPIWRSGGVTFAAKPQDHSQKVNKKMYRGALRCILSELVRQDRLVVVEGLSIAEPKTRDFVKQLKDLSLSNVFIVTEQVDTNLYLAARNVNGVDVRDVQGIDPVSMIRHEKVLVTVGALKQLEESLV